MKKTIAFLISLLFIFSFSSSLSAKTAKKKKSQKQTIQKQEETKTFSEDSEISSIQDEIEKNIETIKFDSDIVSQKRAFNFLLDHINDSRPYILKELLLQDNEDMVLSNFFNLILSSNQDIEIPFLLKSAKLQIQKPKYLYYCLQYLYPRNQKESMEVLQSLLNSELPEIKITSLKIILELKIQNFKEPILKQLNKEKNKEIIISMLETLRHLKLEADDLTKIHPFFSNETAGTSFIASRIFSLYPESFKQLHQWFSDSDRYLEKLAILEAMSTFKNQEVEDFLIDLLNSFFYKDKVVDIFSIRQFLTPKTLTQLIYLYHKNKNSLEILNSILKILSYTYANLETLEKKKIIDFYKVQLIIETEEDIIMLLLTNIYIMKLDENPFYIQILSLQEKFPKNWRIQKLILQILDLKS